MIKIENLSKKFINNGKKLLAISNISFEVREEEFVSIVGPSGCGKTTLLKIIAGLEEPTEGRIFVDSKEVKEPGLDRGIVFQESPLFPWKKLLENIKLALRVKGITKRNEESLAKEYLKKMNLSDFADFYPKELSGGMKQRASLARTLALNPKILLMDEPFGSLDAQTRIMIQEELLKIWENYKKTVLFVTHSIEEAIFLSDKIIIFSPCPATIIDVIDVDFPRPRNFGIRSEKRFNELRDEIWKKIRINL